MKGRSEPVEETPSKIKARVSLEPAAQTVCKCGNPARLSSRWYAPDKVQRDERGRRRRNPSAARNGRAGLVPQAIRPEGLARCAKCRVRSGRKSSPVNRVFRAIRNTLPKSPHRRSARADG